MTHPCEFFKAVLYVPRMFAFLNELRFAKAFWTLAKNPERTDAVFKLFDTIPIDDVSKRHLVERMQSIPEMKPMLEERYLGPKLVLTDLLKLRACPQHS